ncbi:MAG: hypothetical protein ACREPM_07330 [Gemmatimonadaceae bacterium]
MAQLTYVLQDNPKLLDAAYREPGITAYNRLECRPRALDFTRSLRAEVRDALWLLTRQWQFGEFAAEDAASPIDARLLTNKLTIDRVKLGSSPAQAYDDTIPLEARVEAETVPFTHALRVQAAQYFLRLHPSALRAKYLPRYRQAFPFPQNSEADFRGQVDGLNLYVATRRSMFDGEQALAAIADGSFSAKVTIDAGDLTTLQGLAAEFTAWMARQYVQPAVNASQVWSDTQLSYAASVAAPTNTTGSSQIVLTAPRYPGGHLDWSSFEVDPGAAAISLADTAYVPPAPEQEVISFLPVPASFKGMPAARFWEMEERQVNFGALEAQTTDQLLLVFAELGLVYGNDWFVFPYALPANTLCEVLGLVITDVFGDRTLIRAADAGANSWQRWSMFNLSNVGDVGSYNRQFLLPASVGAMLESDPLERVQFARDDVASLVWAVEEVIPDATGRGISGDDAADKTGVISDPIANSPAPIRYVLGTTVPENWIPFIPVQRPGNAQDIVFQRAAMPQMGVPPHDVIRAKGVLLTEAPLPWFVNEEEIPYAGTVVTRSYQRVRWYDGRTFVWIGRRRETGRGVGTSNLRFDQIEPTKQPG